MSRISTELIAILFISLLFGFQADKLFSYLNCRVLNTINNNLKCDCEKEVKDFSNDDQQPNPQKSLSKEKPEELFVGCRGLLSNEFSILTKSALKIPFRSPTIRIGFCSKVFHPPDPALGRT
jgi:hypothetical protein